MEIEFSEYSKPSIDMIEYNQHQIEKDANDFCDKFIFEVFRK